MKSSLYTELNFFPTLVIKNEMSTPTKYSRLSVIQNNDEWAKRATMSFVTGNATIPTVGYQSLPPFEITEIIPQGNKSIVNSGEIVKFVFPNELWVDPSSIRLYFTLKIRGRVSAGTRGGLTYDVSTLFEKGQILYNNIVIENCDRYDWFSRIHANILNEHTSLFHYRSQLESVQAWAPNPSFALGQARRSYLGVGNDVTTIRPFDLPKDFCTQLNFGLFMQNRLIPLPLLGQSLGLNLKVNRTARVVATDATASTIVEPFEIELTNIRLEYMGYRNTPTLLNYENKLGSKIYRLNAYDHFSHIISSVNNKYSINFNLNRKFVKYAVAILRADADETINLESYNCYYSSNPNNASGNSRKTSLKQYQWCVNQVNIPEKPVRVIQPFDDTNDNLSPTQKTHYTSGPQAYTYLEKVFSPNMREYLYGGPYVGEYAFLPTDNGIGTDPLLAPTYPASSHQAVRVPSSFCIVGKFSSLMPTGEMAALETTHRDKVTLNLEFNGTSVDSGLGITLETFFVYESQIVFDTDESGFAYQVTCSS